MVTAKGADFEGIGKQFHIDPVIARILRNRDLISMEQIDNFLHGDLSKMYSPYLLKDMDIAVEAILEAIGMKKKIRIIGDYDVDGVCATYILQEGLYRLGATVDYRLPNRIKDGYGLNEGMIEEAKAEQIDMIITCDNGIAASAAIDYANKLFMKVIVTDHHEVPFFIDEENNKCYIMPQALAVVNPKRADCTYPFSGICGAMVVYKLVEALFEKSQRELPAEFLETAAFATICDVMELKDENRIAVKYGLNSMKHTKNQGLKALMQVCEIKPDGLGAYHIGFVLGPCFNASGRLDIADRVVELLRTKDFGDGVLIARELKELNEQRKSMTEQGTTLAKNYILTHHMEEDKVLVIYLPECHESIAGIIAGRIKEEYYKPTIVLTKSEDCVKGSGRSIEAYNMFEGLLSCQEYFIKFGGHKMAAGLSLKEEYIEPLREKLNRECTLSMQDLEEKLVIDMPLPLHYLNMDLISQLDLLEPFGTGNEKPVFAWKNVAVLSEIRLGKDKKVGKYQISDGSSQREMIYFGDLDAFKEFYQDKKSISIAYYPTINRYRDTAKIQVVLKTYKEV